MATSANTEDRRVRRKLEASESSATADAEMRASTPTLPSYESFGIQMNQPVCDLQLALDSARVRIDQQTEKNQALMMKHIANRKNTQAAADACLLVPKTDAGGTKPDSTSMETGFF